MNDGDATDVDYKKVRPKSMKGFENAKYRKRNLFHAKIGKTKIQESDIFLAGKTSSVAMVRGWKVGLSVCSARMLRDFVSERPELIIVAN